MLRVRVQMLHLLPCCQVLDGKELLQLPVIGDILRRQQQHMPQARKGVNTLEEEKHKELFVQPLITLNAPQRYYYKFGTPISTSPDMARNKDACARIYSQV